MGENRLDGRGAWVLLGLMAVAAAVVCARWRPAEAWAASGEVASGETRVIGGVEYPVNENGETYGSALQGNELAAASGLTYETLEDEGSPTRFLPDLVEVSMPDDSVGYLKKEDFCELPSASNPGELLAWADAGHPASPKPIYEKDGETQVGWWVSVDGRKTAKEL